MRGAASWKLLAGFTASEQSNQSGKKQHDLYASSAIAKPAATVTQMDIERVVEHALRIERRER
jgi:hypothetical protein